MARPGHDPYRPPEGLAPIGDSGQAGRPRTSRRDTHAWRQFMDGADVLLVAQGLTERYRVPGEPRPRRFGDGDHR